MEDASHNADPDPKDGLTAIFLKDFITVLVLLDLEHTLYI